jgi:hypothetical protein
LPALWRPLNALLQAASVAPFSANKTQRGEEHTSPPERTVACQSCYMVLCEKEPPNSPKALAGGGGRKPSFQQFGHFEYDESGRPKTHPPEENPGPPGRTVSCQWWKMVGAEKEPLNSGKRSRAGLGGLPVSSSSALAPRALGKDMGYQCVQINRRNTLKGIQTGAAEFGREAFAISGDVSREGCAVACSLSLAIILGIVPIRHTFTLTAGGYAFSTQSIPAPQVQPFRASRGKWSLVKNRL